MGQEIIYLLATCAIELVVALVVLNRLPKARIALTVCSVNFITHPLAWMAVDHGNSWLLVEICVVAIEAMLLALLIPKQRNLAAITGVLMNLATMAASKLIA